MALQTYFEKQILNGSLKTFRFMYLAYTLSKATYSALTVIILSVHAFPWHCKHYDFLFETFFDGNTSFLNNLLKPILYLKRLAENELIYLL